MIQTSNQSHVIFDHDEIVNVKEQVFQGDVGALVINLALMTDAETPADLTGYGVAVTNCAPNGKALTYCVDGSDDNPISINGNTIAWTLTGFDTFEPGTFRAQVVLVKDGVQSTACVVQYNVERSVSGTLGKQPAYAPALDMFINKANELIPQIDQILDLIGGEGFTWDSLVGKPDTFPPSPHTHEEFTTIADTINGVRCEIANKTITIPNSAWSENLMLMRQEARIEDVLIRPDTDVDLSLSDLYKGRYSIDALSPREGYLMVFTPAVPDSDLEMQMEIIEVRTSAGAITSRVGRTRVIGAASGSTADAGWFGDGSDGDFVVDGTQTIEVEEDTGRILKQYNSLTINEGATLKPSHRCNGMIILVKGDCTINGTLSVDKCAPLLNDAEDATLTERHVKLCGALKGGDGGKGGDGVAEHDSGDGTMAPDCVGGTGGKGHGLGGGYGGGGAGSGKTSLSSGYDGGPAEPRPPKGIEWPATTAGQNGVGGNGSVTSNAVAGNGGAAPGGSGGTNYYKQFIEGQPRGAINGLAGDAYGGGALWLFVGGALKIGTTGIVSANGGDGAAFASHEYLDSTNNPGSGGSGGGGIVAIVYSGMYDNLGTVRASGGKTPALPASPGGMLPDYKERCKGQDGQIGTIFVKNIQEL